MVQHGRRGTEHRSASSLYPHEGPWRSTWLHTEAHVVSFFVLAVCIVIGGWLSFRRISRNRLVYPPEQGGEPQNRQRPRISVALDQVLFDRKSPQTKSDSTKEEDKDHQQTEAAQRAEIKAGSAKSSGGRQWFIIEASVPTLLHLAKTTELFVFAQIDDTSDDRAVINERLESMGAFEAGLKHHRVMFSRTTNGRASMVRQLQPLVHIESDEDVVTTLLGKVPNVVLVCLKAKAEEGAWTFNSLSVCVSTLQSVIY